MDTTLASLAAWMPRQRWYAAKGRSPVLRWVGRYDLPAAGDAAPGVFLVADESTFPVVLYQVPVVARPATAETASADHVIGAPDAGTVLIDGVHDPAFTDALLRLVTEGGRGSGPETVATGIPVGGDRPRRALTASVLRGEQSNTSIIFRSPDEPGGIICKVFRQLHAGLNPDIELQVALAEAGSPFVPAAVGQVEGMWPEPGTDGGARGSLAFAQEFLPGVEDAWRVALDACGRGEDFTDRARELGEATAAVHLDLARLFPTDDDAPREAMTLSWAARLATAVAEVPAIGGLRAGIEAVYRRASEIPWPPLQRVHGDFHLGQVLHVPDRGWVLLDFEGEPLRPMSERRRPDLALRDVAGMLRSFDYVAGSARIDGSTAPAASAETWAGAARTAFLGGYGAVTGLDLDAHRALLTTLELDKAVYEAIYESRNRPAWTAIPLQAIARLAAGDAG